MARPRPALPIVARLLAISPPDCACASCVAKHEAAGIIEALIEALEAAKIAHHMSDEDCWYACPLARHEDGSTACCNHDVIPDKCNCGADTHNAAIDAALARARQAIP